MYVCNTVYMVDVTHKAVFPHTGKEISSVCTTYTYHS